MHGLINRSIQCFLRDTYGPAAWAAIARAAGIGAEGFEAMLAYDDALTGALVAAAGRHLGKPQDALLEDLGIYLVGREPLRRLLRFGGAAYADFLHSLEELPGRGRLALPGLDLPRLALAGAGDGRFRLRVTGRPGFGHVCAGVLRAMADDYGALALIDHLGGAGGAEEIGIELLEPAYAADRGFSLARPAGT